MGEEDRIQEGEEKENQPLHITVEISTDAESDHHEGEENQREEEVGDPEESVEERPDTSRTTRAGMKTRKPERFREAGQVQLSPKERSRRKSRAKFKKFRAEN